MRLHHRLRASRRAGLAIPEWFCVIGGVTVAIVLLSLYLPGWVQHDAAPTADGIGTPSQLIHHPRLQQANAPGQQKQHGNNGLGNGVDPQPPGKAPVNDGPGTSPGNPGNRGGAKR